MWFDFTQVEGYNLSKRLHKNAHAAIYLAQRQKDQAQVVLKVLRLKNPTPKDLEYFRWEYDILKRLEGHAQGVVQAYELLPYGKSLIMVLEACPGDSLAHLLPSYKPTLAEFFSLAVQATSSLSQIHACHVLHKDINPANLLWDRQRDKTKWIDFGIAELLLPDQPRKKPPFVIGTLEYMSPEQTDLEDLPFDFRSDLYSLGATFYRILTGEMLFPHLDARSMMHHQLHVKPKPCREHIPTLPEPLESLVMKLLAKHPDERYQSAQGLLQDLKRMQGQWQQNQSLEAFELDQTAG